MSHRTRFGCGKAGMAGSPGRNNLFSRPYGTGWFGSPATHRWTGGLLAVVPPARDHVEDKECRRHVCQ